MYVIFNYYNNNKILDCNKGEIILYYKSFLLFFILLLKRVNRFLFDLQVIKIQKEWEEITKRYEVVSFSSSKIYGISFFVEDYVTR